MLMPPMLALAPILAMLLAAPMPGLVPVSTPKPGPPNAAVTVPDEPGVNVLPDATILQTAVADLDRDGAREIVRLVRGEDEAVLAEIWGMQAGEWRLRGAPVEVVPPSRIGTRIDPVYQSTPVRLLVRRVAGADHVTVASQPHFEEIDAGPPCCLVLHDLELRGGSAVRREVSGPSDFATSVIVIDFDGDGTDELLSTESLPPAGDISYPIEARVHRWADDAFAPPTETSLPVGSGDSPFALGDSDGLPGAEAGIISTIGAPGLFRLRLIAGDRLELDAAGLTADQAIAVPLGEERGLAVVGPVVGLLVASWPPGTSIAAPAATSPLTDARIVGGVEVGGLPRLVIHARDSDAIHLLSVPGLLPPQGTTITRSPAAAALAGLPLEPFSGPLPGGGSDGKASVIHAGRLIPALTDADRTGTALVGSLAGAEPVGLVGEGRDRIVLHHGPVGRPAPDADGGALVVPALLDQGWTSIAPFELTRQAEADDGDLDPSLRDAIRLDASGALAVGPGGFIAEVAAPPGSRVAVLEFDPSVIGVPIVVPDSGTVDVPFVPPTVATESPRYQAAMQVITPAGHAHLARWDVRVLTVPPPVDVAIATPFGSGSVELRGRTTRFATVRVDGAAVEVSAGGRFSAAVHLPPWPTGIVVEVSDPFGNTTRQTVSGIGFFDYRGLPWVPITASLVAAVGVVLFLRVPRSTAFSRRADDDAVLEELEPD